MNFVLSGAFEEIQSFEITLLIPHSLHFSLYFSTLSSSIGDIAYVVGSSNRNSPEILI